MKLETNITSTVWVNEQAVIPIKKPEDIIGFLREFNFGNPNESATSAVGRFLTYMEDRGNEKLLANEPGFSELIVEELEKAGFLEKGTVSKERWTREAERALIAALHDFESRGKEWQEEVSKKHQDYRP